MFIEVIKAKYIKDYTLRIWFNDGKVKIVDLKSSLQGKVFEPLLQQECFRKFTIKYNTIEWGNGADFAPEYLYELGR